MVVVVGWAIAVIAALFSLVAGICHLEASRAGRKTALRAARRQQKQCRMAARTEEPRRQSRAGGETIAVTDLSALRAIVAGPRQEIGYLRGRMQDAEWRLKSAREKIQRLTETPGQGDVLARSGPAGSEQFRRLRALILREIHPDHAQTDGIDRDVRDVLFKRIWPKIEALSERV